MKTIRELWDASEKQYADIAAVRWLEKKEICEITYQKLGENIRNIRKGLNAEGFCNKHIALIGTSSAPWMESYLGITTGNNTAVPLDAGLPAEDLTDLLNRSDSEGLFLGIKEKALLTQISEKCPKVRKIWLLSEKADEENETLLELIKKGAEGDETEPAVLDEEDVATIIYTSGTTGKSKGVMLTQKNLIENVENVEYEAQPGGAVLSVLPIHHAFCLVMDWLKGFSLGGVICVNDSYMHMVRNMSIFQPGVMLMVPLMIEMIYKKLASAKADVPPQILAKKVFGENLHTIFTGGAHLEPFYIDEFEKYGIQVLEGYGMSECSPVISSNTEKEHKKGSIGKPLKNVQIKFEDGEILVKSTSVMKGYYNMPQETQDALKDGWLHTGDKGYLDEDGYLFINGRVKNLIILSNGEIISPEEIENKLALFELVAEVVVTGENNGLTARIYPEKELVEAKGLDGETLRAALQKNLDDYNLTQPTYRQITGLVIRQNPFIRNATKKILRQEVLRDEPVY